MSSQGKDAAFIERIAEYVVDDMAEKFNLGLLIGNEVPIEDACRLIQKFSPAEAGAIRAQANKGRDASTSRSPSCGPHELRRPDSGEDYAEGQRRPRCRDWISRRDPTVCSMQLDSKLNGYMCN
jgi:hypothetical protein